VWLANERKTVPLLATPFNETSPRLSPDGRWMVYVSDESGRNEVYAVPFVTGSAQNGSVPSVGRGKWQVSNGGGTLPRWRRDGREIFYYDDASGRLMAAAVNGQGPALEVGAPQTLFATSPPGGVGLLGAVQSYFYDVTHDGARFLVNDEGADVPAIVPSATVVVNWLSSSRR
jgi:hypothetical protein